MNARFEVYPRKRRGRPPKAGEETPAQEFGWRFRAGNAQINAVGGEGFTRREDAKRAIRDFISDLRYAATDPNGAPIVDLDSEDFDPGG